MEKPIDEQMICFITAVTDRKEYMRSLATWQKLRVPDGMKVQYIAAAIGRDSSVGRAYRLLMAKSSARYKIYIRQDVEIAEEGFLEKAVAIFKEHSEYGIAGAAGSISLPDSAIWYEGDIAGCIYDDHQGSMQGYRFQKDTAEAALPVMLLDGCILMTSMDVAFSDGFCDKEELYAASMCMAFRKQGLEAVAWSSLGEGIRQRISSLISSYYIMPINISASLP